MADNIIEEFESSLGREYSDSEEETELEREVRLHEEDENKEEQQQQQEEDENKEEEEEEEDDDDDDDETKDEQENKDEQEEVPEITIEKDAERELRLHREKLDKRVQENKSVTLDNLGSYVTNYTKVFLLPTPDQETMQVITESLLAQKYWTDNDGEMHWQNSVVDPLLSILIAVQ